MVTEPSFVRPSAKRPHQLAVLGLLAAAGQAAWGQSSPETALAAAITTSVNQVETRRSSGRDESGLVLQARPSVDLTSRSGRVRGALRYSASLQHDTASKRGGSVTHNLDAKFTAEAVENWFFVDATADVSRRAVSAFGVQADPSSPRRDDTNYQHVASATLRPYVRGALGGLASYNAALFRSATRAGRSQLGDVDQTGADLALASLGGGFIGWGLNGSRHRTKFVAGRATVDDRVFASVFLRPDVDWNFSLRAGQESTDVGSLDKRSYDNWGGGVRWTPSPRTVLSADVDERYFGRSWQLLLEHRFARSALRLSSSRGASNSGASGLSGDGTTAYDLFFAQFASVQPDPVLRDIAVRQYLLFLGVDPNTRLIGGTLGTAVALQRRTDLGWTFTGQRLTLALQAFSAASQTLDTQSSQLGDSEVAQKGLLATAGWRLTPTAGASVSVSHMTTASTAARRGNDLNSVSFSLSERLGERTSTSVNARHSRQSGGPNPYRETAIGAALSHRF